LKVNPFGLFVKLDDEIHGLAHISQLELAKQEKINETFKSGEEKDFEIISISPTEHRLALKLVVKGKKKSEKKSVAEQAETTETVEEKPKKAKVKKETIKE
jgi:small subunit ribosomal protein S1